MSLYRNINRRKKLGISRSKKKSTITAEAYANMKAGFPKKKKQSQEINMPKGKGYKKGDLNKDGKMSSYESRRSNAIKNAIAKKKRNKLKIA